MEKQTSRTEVIIDADFFNALTELVDNKKKEYKTDTCFVNLMNDLHLQPVMSQFVYEFELMKSNETKNEIAEMLVESGFIKIYTFDELFQEESDEAFYDITFGILYGDMNGRKWNHGGKHAKEYRISGENLGEIHSSILAGIIKVPYLFSNDKDARKILVEKIRVEYPDFGIYKLDDVFEKYAKDIAASEKTIPYSFFKQHFKGKIKQAKFEEIRQAWIG